MNRRFCVYFILFVLMIPGKVEAQRWKLQRYEVSFGLGTVHPVTDIGPSAPGFKSFQLSSTRPNATLAVRYKILETVSVGMDLSYLMLAGTDVDNLVSVHSFTSNAFEHVLNVHYNFLTAKKSTGSAVRYNKRGMVNNFNTSDFYVLMGAGGILSKSKAYHTNGEIVLVDNFFDNNMQYGLVSELGLGMKYTIGAYLAFGVEIAGRLTLTDLIDGYTSEYSNYNDRYLTTSFKAIYKISNDRRGLPTFKRHDRW